MDLKRKWGQTGKLFSFNFHIYMKGEIYYASKNKFIKSKNR